MTLVIEGTSELAYLSALDRRIAGLSERRRAFVTAAHELAHHVLDVDAGANRAGMTAFLGSLDLLRAHERVASVDWSAVTSADAAFPATVLILNDGDGTAPRLPSWTTSEFAGTPPGAWLRITRTALLARLEQLAGPRIAFRLADDIRSFISDRRATVQRALDALLAVARQCAAEIRSLQPADSPAPARLGRLPGNPGFVLVILAVCRHYGHRSEPGDHAFLLIRRHLVSMGSCATA